MTAVLEHSERADAVSYPAAAPIDAIKATLADAWPPAMIAFGGILTLLWSGGLAWLLLQMILALM